MTDARPRRPRPLTVRSRIVGLLTLLALIGMMTAGTIAYLVERSRVLEQIETNLDAALDSASFTVTGREWASSEAALEAIVQRLAPDDNTGTLGIVDGRAALVPGIQTDLALERLPGFVDRAVAETADGDIVIGTYGTDDATVRYLAAPVRLGEEADPPRSIFVTGYDVRAELAELDDAARVFTVTALVMTAVTFAAGLLVSGRLLAPIRWMREMAERISAQNLDERLPVTARDDVAQLATTVNGMLDRLRGSMDAQRQLLQDVGHELKTPITIVRGHLELVDADDPHDVRQTTELAIDELDRMARLVDDIRMAAQVGDPGGFRFEETEVDALVARIAEKARAIDGADLERAVLVSPAVAVIDPERITQAVLQLVANAVRHAEGPIALGARVQGAELELFVRDRGPGVPDAHKRVIFERFRRGAAEGRGDGGSGLGLAIVRLIAERHGGRASVADAGGGSEFRVTLPGVVVRGGGAALVEGGGSPGVASDPDLAPEPAAAPDPVAASDPHPPARTEER